MLTSQLLGTRNPEPQRTPLHTRRNGGRHRAGKDGRNWDLRVLPVGTKWHNPLENGRAVS